MPKRSYRQYCALARALDVVGDRWSMLIVRNLLLGPQRWSALIDTLPGIARNLLSSRLAQLIQDGVVARDGDLYQLTPAGAELQTALFALSSWGEAHHMGPPGDDDAFRIRYLMTSIRRKLGPGPRNGWLQVCVGDDRFAICIGAKPRVEQGEHPTDASLTSGLPGLRGLLFLGATVDGLQAKELITVTGDRSVVDAFVQDWRAAHQ